MALDIITPNGASHGSVASTLMASGMNPAALRTNATLRKDEWIQMDQAILQIARKRMRLTGLMLGAGMRYGLSNALGSTVVQHQRVSGMTGASASMDAVTRTQRDRVEFDLVSTPIPIVHKEFMLTTRELEASRRMGQSLDVTQAQESTRMVSEFIEEMIISGLSKEDTFGYGGDFARLYGLLNFPSRITDVDGLDYATAGGEAILANVLEMVKALKDNRHFGPYTLLVNTIEFVGLQRDFKANSDKSIYERLLEIPDIQAIVELDFMPTGNKVLLEMSPTTMDIIDGFQPMMIQWDSQGGLVFEFKVMAIMVPRPKADYNGRTGILHATLGS